MTQVTSVSSAPVTIDWETKLDQAEKKRKAASSFNLENFAIVNTALSGIRATYTALGVIWQTRWIHKIVHDHDYVRTLEKGYQEFGHVVNTSQILNAVGIISYSHKLYNACGKILEKDRVSTKRFDQGLKVLFSVSMIGEAFSSAVGGLESIKACMNWLQALTAHLDPVFKTILVWATTIGVYSLAFSAVSLVIHARSWWKTRAFAQEFMKAVDFNKADPLTQANYDKLKQFFNIYDPAGKLDEKKVARLKRYFQVDGEILAARVEMAFKNGIQSKEDQANLAKMMNLLIDRIETTKKNHLFSFIGDLGSLVSSAMVIVSFLHPLGYVGLGLYSLAMVGNYFYKKVSAYNFETQVGVINRAELDPMNGAVEDFETVKEVPTMCRIVDFLKWFFCRLEYYKRPPKMSTAQDAVVRSVNRAFTEIKFRTTRVPVQPQITAQ